LGLFACCLLTRSIFFFADVQIVGNSDESQWPGLRELKNYSAINFYVQPENKLRAQFSDISDAGLDLLNRMLTYDPSKRISAKEAH
jgi:serine/threonine protein kinase